MPSVLLVDDEELLRRLFRRMLESSGYEVVEAVDGDCALREYRRRPADVVLCDLFMPGRDGLELIRELLRDFPTAKVIAMSGGGIGGNLAMLPVALRLGASTVLPKPMSRATLLAAIEQATGAVSVC